MTEPVRSRKRKRLERRFGGPTDIQDAWRVLAGGAAIAATTLVQISEKGKSESSRVAASKTILEMTGFGGRDVIPVRIVPSQFDPTATVSDGRVPDSEIIRQRMELLAAPTYDPNDADDSVIDAVLVEEPGAEYG